MPNGLGHALDQSRAPSSPVHVIRVLVDDSQVTLTFRLRDQDGTCMIGSRTFPITVGFSDFEDFQQELWNSSNLMELPKAEEEEDNPPDVSSLWMLPVLTFSTAFASTLIHIVGVNLASIAYTFSVGTAAMVLGTRHALILALLSAVVRNWLLIWPQYQFSAPDASELILTAFWVFLSIAVPWLRVNVHMVRSWVVALDREAAARWKRTKRAQ